MVALLAEGVDRNYIRPLPAFKAAKSPSSRRAWIEMYCQRMRSPYRWSPSSRRAWIEIDDLLMRRCRPWSPSSRRAWIEIFRVGGFRLLLSVALLAEGVDRNMEYYEKLHEKYRVALLAEGVDRNKYSPRTLSHARVALLAEGVDRNSVVGV